MSDLVDLQEANGIAVVSLPQSGESGGGPCKFIGNEIQHSKTR